jgi:uncharacterized membrane protein (DUF373 family)
MALAFPFRARQQHSVKIRQVLVGAALVANTREIIETLSREWKMDAATAFSTDAILVPLLIAAVIYVTVIRPLYQRND